MPTYNDYGIVLNSHDLGESDKILNIYTKENSLVRAVIKGARKPTSKFSGRVDQLSCCYFHFAKGKNLDTLCDCEQVNSFPSLRSNLTRLTSAVLFLEIVSNFAHEDEGDSHHVYELLYESLDRLQTSSNPDLDSVGFISKFLSLHGYKPQFETCVHCSVEVGLKPILGTDLLGQANMSAPSNNYPYSSILGGVLCHECAKIIDHKKIKSDVINILQQGSKSQQPENIRLTLDLLREHIDIRAKNKIKSFDLVFSL
jgi:DNA repair protein RecO (recombination protein O)